MVQYQISERVLVRCDGLERAIDEGAFAATARANIRELAEALGVSPTTVNAAYSQLRAWRIAATAAGFTRYRRSKIRGGATVFDPACAISWRPIGPGVPAASASFIERTMPEGRLYGENPCTPAALAAARIKTDGIDQSMMMIASGAADACQFGTPHPPRAGDKIALKTQYPRTGSSHRAPPSGIAVGSTPAV